MYTHCAKACLIRLLLLYDYVLYLLIDLQTSVVDPLLNMHLPAVNQLLEDIDSLGDGKGYGGSVCEQYSYYSS